MSISFRIRAEENGSGPLAELIRNRKGSRKRNGREKQKRTKQRDNEKKSAKPEAKSKVERSILIPKKRVAKQ